MTMSRSGLRDGHADLDSEHEFVTSRAEPLGQALCYPAFSDLLSASARNQGLDIANVGRISIGIPASVASKRSKTRGSHLTCVDEAFGREGTTGQ